MGILDTLTTNDTEIKPETDSIGTSFEPLESNIYDLTILLSYISVANSEAMALNILFETSDNKQLRQQFWMTSGKAKGKKNFYEKKNKQGQTEKFYLPGFNQANGIALLTCNKSINQLTTETKTINLYDFDQKKEVPTDVDMVVELIGKSISAGVIKQVVDQNKADAKGVYHPTGKTRTENEVDKLFHSDGRTIVEIKAKEEKAMFRDSWLKKWVGVVKDKTQAKAGVVNTAPSNATATPDITADSLFKD